MGSHDPQGEPNPPTLQDVLDARGPARKAAAQQDRRAHLGSRSVREMVRRQAGRYVLVGMLLSLLANGVFGYFVLDTRGRLDDADVQRAQDEVQRVQDGKQLQAARSSLDAANAMLTARGQPPVMVPANSDPTDAITAAITARVVSQLSPTPTAQQVAQIVAPVVAANVAVPPEAVTASVASYLAANVGRVRGPEGDQGPKGDQGNQGDQGRAPTQAEIDAAVAAERARNPPAPGRNGTDGKDGRDGVSQTDQEFVVVDGRCVSRVSYSDGRFVDRPAGVAACPDVSRPPPDTGEPEPTTSMPDTTEATPTG